MTSSESSVLPRRIGSRAARHAFLADRAERIYDEVTDGYRRRMFLDEIVYTVAELWPGLAPTREEIAAERTRRQGDKEGHEVDQGILLSHLLADRRAGTHLLESQLQPSEPARRLLPEFRTRGEVQLETVHLERWDGVAYLTIGNHEFLNAEDDRLGRDMETAIDLVLLDEEVEVGVVRGGVMLHERYAGRRVFSAGINLTHLYHGQISFVNFVLGREVGYLNKIFRGLLVGGEPVEKPWIAAVDSFAIGGGFQLLLVFDHVIACDDSYVSLPALREGIIPGMANLRLTRTVGARQARRLLLGGARLPANGPDALTWCDEVVPAAQIEESIAAAAKLLRMSAVTANRRMVRLAEEPLETFRRYAAPFALEQVQRMYSADVLQSLERAWMRRRAARR
ncbi:Enoyl-CoA hydratase/isomerase [Kribbella flavida DSM 17836]|uniref:Enoyl-CoA hydratase/isomerase n=1 Tax=Kribbella flavida (strain DSM 17836 / JCM 10339 / NBRC 14399) TaxID=479435 RepID=D2PSN9_KRIFD|nr:enoyl-CoA hydratase/isomerase family protein [Kribbella flavida]ADB33177.1 Enoyl-CoA hydratase/isomerase [Kribbella flavida DSM 17836]